MSWVEEPCSKGENGVSKAHWGDTVVGGRGKMLIDRLLFWARINARSSYSLWEPVMTGIRTADFTVAISALTTELPRYSYPWPVGDVKCTNTGIPALYRIRQWLRMGAGKQTKIVLSNRLQCNSAWLNASRLPRSMYEGATPRGWHQATADWLSSLMVVYIPLQCHNKDTIPNKCAVGKDGISGCQIYEIKTSLFYTDSNSKPVACFQGGPLWGCGSVNLRHHQ